MFFVSMILCAIGVVLSSVSGLACWMGSSSLVGQVDWIPGSEMLLAYPAATLALGVALTIMCAVVQPSRVE